jgi:hypothetical protein
MAANKAGYRFSTVMPGLVPGIHVFFLETQQDVDGRDNKPGHDETDGPSSAAGETP